MKKLIVLLIAVLLPAGAYAADTDTGSPTLTKKEQRRTLRGYKAFVDVAYGFAVSDDFDELSDKIIVSTSHGYQFSNFFFLGGGVGINECTKTNVMVPIFADLRVNILDKRISPVIDFKWGYAVGDHHGVYLSFNAGVRFGFNKQNTAIYALAEASCIGDTGNGLFHLENKSRLCGRFFLRIGYEF